MEERGTTFKTAYPRFCHTRLKTVFTNVEIVSIYSFYAKLKDLQNQLGDLLS